VSARGGARAVLFELDGTLLASRGITAAVERVAEEVFATSVRSLNVRADGMTDPEILACLLGCAADGAPPVSPRLVARFEVAWARALRSAIASGDVAVAAQPGARELVAALAARADCRLGVVTGNLRTSARVKLDAVGLAEPLAIGAYGSDAPSRRLLPALALARIARATGADVPASAAVVVGDTPHDVACARAAGMRCVLVATGGYDRAELAGCGSDALLDDLADRERALAAILGGP